MFVSNGTRFVVKAAWLLAVPLALAACGSNYGPGPMPTGYAHQNKVHKAQTGPNPLYMDPERLQMQEREATRYHPGGRRAKAAYEGAAYGGASFDAHDSAAAGWDGAAQDLVARLVNTLGRPTETVQVVPGAYPALEDALRRALQGQSISVSRESGRGPFTIEYIVTPITDSSMVSITLLSIGRAVEEVSGIYDVGMIAGDSLGPFGAAPVSAPVNAPMNAPMNAMPPADTGAPMPILPIPGGFND